VSELVVEPAVAREGSAGGERRQSAWRSILHSTEGRIGLGLALVVLGIIIVGPLVAPYPPAKLGVGPATALPSGAHLLGTDDLGRDVLSRFLSGGRSVLVVPVVAVTIALLIGGAIGLFGAYRGGTVDRVLTAVIDVLMALPALLIVLVFLGALGNSSAVVIACIAVAFIPRLARSVRGAAQACVTSDYVAAAEARGESLRWILWREITPNIVAPVIATYTVYLTYGIIFAATLSFLGLGAQPPSSDWGLMVAQSRIFITSNVFATIAPVSGIAALSVCFTLIADAATRHLTHDSNGGRG
jgi:peptide/nickel transport system permease protein